MNTSLRFDSLLKVFVWMLVVGVLMIQPVGTLARTLDTRVQQDTEFSQVIAQAIQNHSNLAYLPFYFEEVGRLVNADGSAGVAYIRRKNKGNNQFLLVPVELIVAIKSGNEWSVKLPGDDGYTATKEALPPEILNNIDPRQYEPIFIPNGMVPMALDDYRLPWEHEEWATVTRSYNTGHGTGQIDFDLDADALVTATKSGTIVYANDAHWKNGEDEGAWWYNNAIIIQHTSNEFSAYYHIAPDTIPDWITSACSTDYTQSNCSVLVQSGQVIGEEGNTGYSSNPHLHFETGTCWTPASNTDNLDEDGDNDFTELVYTGLICGGAQLNIAFVGYTTTQVANWAYNTRLQSDNPYTPPGSTWQQTAKLLASDGAVGDEFGVSASLSGNSAIIGSHGEDFWSGAAYVFMHGSGGSWVQHTKLTASDRGFSDSFGYSVALDGNTAIIGAHRDDDRGSDSGSAYVFVRDGGGNWHQQAKLLASDGAAGDYFGVSVAISGDTAVIAADGDDDRGSDSGSAYVFVRDGGGNWHQQAKLLASDGAAGDKFGSGRSVALNGDTIVIGSERDDDRGSDSGSAYVFVRDGGGNWHQQAKLLASDGAAGDEFSHSVTLNENTAIIGVSFDDDRGSDSGSAYVFVRDGGGNWHQQAKLLASDGAAGDRLGWSVALRGDTAMVGAWANDDRGSDSGSAYVFVRDGGGNWHQQAKLLASDGAAGDWFGRSVVLSENTAMISAWANDDLGSSSGSVYVFEGPPVPNQSPTITNPGNQTSTEGDAISLPISASDPDGDTLTYNAGGLPFGLSINTSTGLISGTIASGAAVNSPYSVTVMVTDGALSDSMTFQWTVTRALMLLTPSGTVNKGNGDPIYSWADVDATGYDFYVTAGPIDVISDVIYLKNLPAGAYCDGTTCSFDPAPMNEVYARMNGTYYVWLREWDYFGTNEWKGPFTFTMDAPPPAVPTLGSVSDVTTSRPTIHWTLTTEAEAYASWFHMRFIPVDASGTPTGASVEEHWIRRSALCGSPTGTTCEFTTWDDIPLAQRYAVELQSYGPGGFNGDDKNIWSAPLYFNAGGDPAVTPGNITVNPNQGRPTIAWDDDPDATWFQVYVGNTTQGTLFFEWVEKATITCDGSRCEMTPEIDPVADMYQVYIRAYSPGGMSEWGGPETFDLSGFAPPPAVTTFHPVANADSGQPTFRWEGVERAIWYQLWVGALQPTTTTHHFAWHLAADLGCENAETCTVTPNNLNLAPGQYSWFLRSWGPGGFSVGDWVQGPEFDVN